MPINLQAVPVHDTESANSALRIPHSAFLRQPAVPFDGDDVTHAGREHLRQAPLPRPDLYHDVVGRGLERVDDALQDVPVGEEVLAEPLVRDHTLRMTTVRSSAGGAPAPQPARPAGARSPESRARRASHRAPWPAPRSSPA